MTFTIADLEKALKYAKSQNAVVVSIKEDINDRLVIGAAESFKGSGASIVIYSSDSAKMPTITREETLF